MAFHVRIGPAAVALWDGYWIGAASGNRYCKQKRRTSKKALADARKLEKHLTI